MGMVTEPVVTVLPTEEPETMPQSAEEMTATLAGPPEKRPTSAFARLIKNSAIPVRSRKAPNIIKIMIYLAQTLMGVESMPSVE